MCRRMLLGLLCLGIDIATVRAQDDWSSPLLAPPPTTQPPTPAASPPLEPAPGAGTEQAGVGIEQAEPYHAPGPHAYAFKGDIAFEVPVPLTDDADAAGTGVGISGAFGLDLGYVVPTANIGWSWTPLDVPDQDAAGDDRTLTRLHLGFGLMAELDNRSFVVPVFGAMLDLNWWHVSGDTGVACGGYYYWGCYAYNRYDYTTGFTFKAGLDFRLPKNDRFSLGIGVLPSVTLSGGPFRDTEWWISPYAVFTIRG